MIYSSRAMPFALALAIITVGAASVSAEPPRPLAPPSLVPSQGAPPTPTGAIPSVKPSVLVGGLNWVGPFSGSFLMGSTAGGKDEIPVHPVTLSPYMMSKTEVTVKQYAACVDDGGCDRPKEDSTDKFLGEFNNWGHPGRDWYPINGVNWEQAHAFCEWAGGALPTEAQWEFAARSGGQDILFPWGDAEATCDVAVMKGLKGCGAKRTQPVCSKTKGNTKQGLCDMAGNVWEWVADWYGPYKTSAETDPTGPSHGKAKIERGGSWNFKSRSLRAANRGDFAPSVVANSVGFRCAKLP